MQRKQLGFLASWLASPSRRPLVLRGARQVGKTWLIRELARTSGRRLLELNLERPEHRLIDWSGCSLRDLVTRIETATRQRLQPAECLLFLDEVQAAPGLLGQLRWLYEDLPELPVVAAGSLLEFALGATTGMPVGRIQYCHVEPLGFIEHCWATGRGLLAERVVAWRPGESWDPLLHAEACRAFREFLVVGGMPAAVQAFCTEGSLAAACQVHNDLVATFQDDFPRYAARVPPDRLLRTLHAVAAQLGTKFMVNRIDPGSRHEGLRAAFDLLLRARLCHTAVHTAGTGIPLGAEAKEKYAKAFLLDVGLAHALLGLGVLDGVDLKAAVFAARGGLAEQVCAQLLRAAADPGTETTLHCWARQGTADAEVDFLHQHGRHIVPIEVKACAPGRLRSLHLFMAERGLCTAVRFHLAPPALEEIAVHDHQGRPIAYRLLNLPLYCVECLDVILDAVLT